jgi:hypothetical protein
MVNDQNFKWAAMYAKQGWHVVTCYGLNPTENGRACSCRKGHDCSAAGKHPVGGQWQHRATTDEDAIYDALDVSSPRNIGVQWGARSGVIDIEFDCEKGRHSASKYGLDKKHTPTYTSKRSTHRIFKWTDKLPKAGVVKVEGLEVRIGGDNKGSQSIVPPSLHHSGVSYQWVEGMTPEDCEPAEIPQELLLAINNEFNASGCSGKPAANAILHGRPGEGDRHDHLLMYANRQALRMDNIDSPVEQQELLITLRALNKDKCDPPKKDKEIETLWRDALMWAKRKRMNGDLTAEERAAAVDARAEGKDDDDDEQRHSGTFTLSGLEYREGEWFPGTWSLRVVHGDPVSYILTIPVYRKDLDDTLSVGVTLDAEQYRSCSKVAQAILEATHVVIVDSVPEEWATIWNGRGPKKGKPAVRGLKAKLMEVAVSETATAENCRYAAVAGWFLDVLTHAPLPNFSDLDSEPGKPDVQGIPQWVRNEEGFWELWFGWERAWEMANHGKRGIVDSEKVRLKRMLLSRAGEDALTTSRWASEGGPRRRYVRLQKRHLEHLEAIASGEAGISAVTAYRPRIEAGSESH